MEFVWDLLGKQPGSHQELVGARRRANSMAWRSGGQIRTDIRAERRVCQGCGKRIGHGGGALALSERAGHGASGLRSMCNNPASKIVMITSGVSRNREPTNFDLPSWTYRLLRCARVNRARADRDMASGRVGVVCKHVDGNATESRLTQTHVTRVKLPCAHLTATHGPTHKTRATIYESDSVPSDEARTTNSPVSSSSSLRTLAVSSGKRPTVARVCDSTGTQWNALNTLPPMFASIST